MSVRVTIVSTALAAMLCATAVAAQETPRMGGVLKVASVGEPPTLDIAMSTAVIVYEIMWHVNESLFTYDKACSRAEAAAQRGASSKTFLAMRPALMAVGQPA